MTKCWTLSWAAPPTSDMLRVLAVLAGLLGAGRALRLSSLRLPSRHEVHYLPAGHQARPQHTTACPAPATSTSGGAGQHPVHLILSCRY